jgi:hypothetical protein
VLLLELLHNILLLLLIAVRLPGLLLPLIIHHLLDHPARLTIQIAQLAVFRRNLADVDARGAGHDVLPPLHLVGLGELDAEFLGAGGQGFEGPGGVVEEDGVGEGALWGGSCVRAKRAKLTRLSFMIQTYLNNCLLPSDPSLDAVLLDHNIEILALEVSWDFDRDLKVSDGLGPFVRQLALLFLLFSFGVCVEALAL